MALFSHIFSHTPNRTVVDASGCRGTRITRKALCLQGFRDQRRMSGNGQVAERVGEAPTIHYHNNFKFLRALLHNAVEAACVAVFSRPVDPRDDVAVVSGRREPSTSTFSG